MPKRSPLFGGVQSKTRYNFSMVASPRNRLHKLGHRNVTIPLKTRWFTPAGLCISTRKFGAFARRQSSLVSKPRDAPGPPSPPQKAQIGAKGSKPRDAPQTRPVLRNPAKHGTFAFLNRREVLAKNASGSDMKNLTIASRGSVTREGRL